MAHKFWPASVILVWGRHMLGVAVSTPGADIYYRNEKAKRNWQTVGDNCKWNIILIFYRHTQNFWAQRAESHIGLYIGKFLFSPSLVGHVTTLLILFHFTLFYFRLFMVEINMQRLPRCGLRPTKMISRFMWILCERREQINTAIIRSENLSTGWVLADTWPRGDTTVYHVATFQTKYKYGWINLSISCWRANRFVFDLELCWIKLSWIYLIEYIFNILFSYFAFFSLHNFKIYISTNYLELFPHWTNNSHISSLIIITKKKNWKKCIQI